MTTQWRSVRLPMAVRHVSSLVSSEPSTESARPEAGGGTSSRFLMLIPSKKCTKLEHDSQLYLMHKLKFFSRIKYLTKQHLTRILKKKKIRRNPLLLFLSMTLIFLKDCLPNTICLPANSSVSL